MTGPVDRPARRLLPALLGIAVLVLLLVVPAGALATNPVDRTFGTRGVAEIEAQEKLDWGGPLEIGGVVDLAPARGGRMLAALRPTGGRPYFAAARILPNGRLDKGFGTEGFTPPLKFSRLLEGGLTEVQSEAVAEQKDGRVIVAGYRRF